jgi:hypothetical protein
MFQPNRISQIPFPKFELVLCSVACFPWTNHAWTHWLCLSFWCWPVDMFELEQEPKTYLEVMDSKDVHDTHRCSQFPARRFSRYWTLRSDSLFRYDSHACCHCCCKRATFWGKAMNAKLSETLVSETSLRTWEPWREGAKDFQSCVQIGSC